MIKRRWLWLLAYLGAITGCFLWHDSLTPHDALPLFASWRVGLVYCVATLPICMIIARRVTALHSMTGLWLCSGVGCLSAWALPACSNLLTQLEAGYLLRGCLRAAVAGLILLPAASLWFASPNLSNSQQQQQQRQRFRSLSLSEGLLAGVCAILLPAVYVHVQASRLKETYLSQVGKGRTRAELQTLQAYSELRGQEFVANRKLSVVLRELKRQVRELESQAGLPLANPASSDALQRRAMQLLSLERPSQVLELLAQHERQDATLMLLGAMAARELKQWDKVEQLSLALLANTPCDRLALELQAESLHAQRKLERAVEVYHQLLNGTGKNEAAYHLRLGMVLMDCGDRRAALTHFETASRINPSLHGQVQGYQRTVLQSSCGLR